MDNKKVIAVADLTRLRIIIFLSEEPGLTNTELFKKLKMYGGPKYRETVFKALVKLKKEGLVKREYIEKRGFEYFLNFKGLHLSSKVNLTIV